MYGLVTINAMNEQEHARVQQEPMTKMKAILDEYNPDDPDSYCSHPQQVCNDTLMADNTFSRRSCPLCQLRRIRAAFNQSGE